MPDLNDFSDAPWCDGEAIAVMEAHRSLTYADLEADVSARVRLLHAQGLRAGQVVMAPDAPVWDLVLMQHSLARLRAVLFPFRAGTACPERAALGRLAGVEWEWCPGEQRLVSTGAAGAQAVDAESEDVRLLIKTSGSSGAPKAAMLTAESLLSSALAVNERLSLRSGDIWLACLRQSHIGGLSIGYRCALAGAAMCLHEGFDAVAVSRDLRALPVTHVSLVPPMLSQLLDLDATPPPDLRVLLVGGQALSPSLAERALEAGWPLHLTYGMTETASQIATTGSLVGRSLDPSSAGDLLPGVELDIAGCEAAPRRLRVRGPMVMAGYANPARSLGQGLDAGGWLETADLGCLAAGGQLRILGRADDILVIGGLNVSRPAVEHAIAGAPGVRECVVAGLREDVWGHRLAVAFAGEAEEAALDAWCRSQLASPQRPRTYLRMDRLPLLDSGKYDRRRIAELLEAVRCRAGSVSG